MDDTQRTFTEGQVRDIVNKLLDAQAIETVALICLERLPGDLAMILVESLVAAERRTLRAIAGYQLASSPEGTHQCSEIIPTARRFEHWLQQYQYLLKGEEKDTPF